MLPSYQGLLTIPTGVRALLPAPYPSHLIKSFSVETPAGTFHHSGGGTIFDIKQHEAARQTEPVRSGFSFANMEEVYLRANPALFHDMFGFGHYDQAADFFEQTWRMDLDECGVAHPKSFSAFQEYLLSLWRMRQRPSLEFASSFAGVSKGNLSEVCKEWIPRCGKAGRSWVWVPSMDFIRTSSPQSFVEAGMQNVGFIGDATDLLTDTVRAMISVRNQQHSDKSKHSAAMAVSWCTPIGWTAIASDLVLGRSSEYNTAVAMAPHFASVPPDIALCYDKGVASLRAHLPNLNNVIVPCFLSGGQYTAEQAIRNRAVATNRYVIEITYSRVKAWDMLKPVIPRTDFALLNEVWWWALGFANLTCKPLKQPYVVNVCI
jgi:hypothetical protein